MGVYPNDVVMVKYEIIDPFGTIIGRGIVPMVYAQLEACGLVHETVQASFLLGVTSQLQHAIQFHL